LTEAARSSKGLSLEQAADFLIRHSYALLFGWVLLEQMGLPIPAVPLLIAAPLAAFSFSRFRNYENAEVPARGHDYRFLTSFCSPSSGIAQPPALGG